MTTNTSENNHDFILEQMTFYFILTLDVQQGTTVTTTAVEE